VVCCSFFLSDFFRLVPFTVLADAINLGYSDMSNQVLAKVNGVKVRNLAHVRELVESVSEGAVCFELEDHRLLVVDAAAARAAMTRLLTNHRIPTHVSLPLQQSQHHEQDQTRPEKNGADAANEKEPGEENAESGGLAAPGPGHATPVRL
jgi:hypothetical protein